MGQGVWVIGLAVLLVLSGITFAVLGGDDPEAGQGVASTGAQTEDGEPTVLRYPYAGDRVRYETVSEDQSDDENETSQTQWSWRNEAIVLPNGAERALPARVSEPVPEDEATEEEGEDGEQTTFAAFPGPLRSTLDAARHDPFAGSPGLEASPAIPHAPAGFSSAAVRLPHAQSDASSWSHETYVSAYTNYSTAADVYRFTQGYSEVGEFAGTQYQWKGWINRTQISRAEAEPDPCDGTFEQMVSGLSASQAETLLLSCVEEALADNENVTLDRVDSGWTQTERFEQAWRIQVRVLYTGEDVNVNVTETFTTSPQASVLVAYESLAQGTADGEPVDAVQRRTIQEWTPGTEPLDMHQAPIETMPSVPTVAWDATGPTEGDLAQFPFAAAKEAVEGTSEGGSYFENAENPWVLYGSFAESETETRDFVSIGSSSSSYGPVECEQEGTTPSQEAPSEANELAWSMAWYDDEAGYLWGSASEPRAARENPTGQPLPMQQASAEHEPSAYETFDLEPTRTGPSLTALWESRTVADAFQDRGRYALSLDGFVSSFSDDPQGIDGTVARIYCVDSQDGSESNAEAGRVTFSNGEALAVHESHYWTTSQS